jgi:hypothetical protein
MAFSVSINIEALFKVDINKIYFSSLTVPSTPAFPSEKAMRYSQSRGIKVNERFLITDRMSRILVCRALPRTANVSDPHHTQKN